MPCRNFWSLIFFGITGNSDSDELGCTTLDTQRPLLTFIENISGWEAVFGHECVALASIVLGTIFGIGKKLSVDTFSASAFHGGRQDGEEEEEDGDDPRRPAEHWAELGHRVVIAVSNGDWEELRTHGRCSIVTLSFKKLAGLFT